MHVRWQPILPLPIDESFVEDDELAQRLLTEINVNFREFVSFNDTDIKNFTETQKIASNELSRLLTLFGYRSAFYTKNPFSRISKVKDTVQMWEKSGVYKLQCAECSAVCIGQIGRCSKARIREHEDAWSQNRAEKSHFATYLIHKGHS